MKPAKLTKLKTGKSLAAFPGFVDTFNYLVDFVNNVKGDKDVNPATGTVVIDLKDAEHPVLRWNGKQGSANGETFRSGGFAIQKLDIVAHRITMKNPYWRRAGRFKIYSQQPFTTQYTPGKILCMNIDETPPGDAVTFFSMTAAELAAWNDVNNTRIPLYEFAADGKLLADLRNLPVDVAWEV